MLGDLGTRRSIGKSCSSFQTKSKPIFLNPAFEIFTSDGWGKSIPQDGEPEKPYLEAVRTTEDLSALSKIDLSHFIKLFPTRKYFPYQEIFCAAQLFKAEQNILSLKWSVLVSLWLVDPTFLAAIFSSAMKMYLISLCDISGLIQNCISQHASETLECPRREAQHWPGHRTQSSDHNSAKIQHTIQYLYNNIQNTIYKIQSSDPTGAKTN